MFFRGGSGSGYFRLLPLLGSMVSHSLSEALPLALGKMFRQLMAVPRGLGCSGVGGAVDGCPSRDPLGDCAGFSPFPLSPCMPARPDRHPALVRSTVPLPPDMPMRHRHSGAGLWRVEQAVRTHGKREAALQGVHRVSLVPLLPQHA